MRIPRPILGAIVLVGALLAACGESPTSSQDGLDVEATSRSNATLNSLVNGAGASSVAALAGRLPVELGGASSAGSPEAAPGVAGIAERLLRSLPGASGPSTAAVIRPQVLGRTYTYDPGARRYVFAPGRAGAPENGVRFILYAVDPVSREPDVAHETGFAELTDLAPAGPGARLDFRAVAGGKLVLEYDLTLSPTILGGTLQVSGMLQDDQDRLNFGFSATTLLPGGAATRVTFELDVPTQHFHAEGAINTLGNGSSGRVQVGVTIAAGDAVIHFSGSSSATVVDAAISVNGHLLATITGNPRQPTVRGSGGRVLSPEEMQTLGGLVGMVYGVFEMFEHLLEPAAAILGVALWL